MIEPWKIIELNRFGKVMLQITHNNEIVGNISVDETDMESRGLWKRAIKMMNNPEESSQKSS